MHTLSVFPALLDYAQFSPLILRAALGIIIGLMAHQSLRAKLAGAPLFSPATFHGEAIVHLLEFVAAILLIIGLFTQVAALAVIIFVTLRWNAAKKSFMSFEQKTLFVLLKIVALSIMFFGAGFFAFDLPL